ncbi:RNA polymerase sigma factor [Nocardioides zeicaulis]|uniref:RNA polymerase sigma factor n=1 Tax=Nocardioides zeicaulis TaxID=1776857 RepID=A0ABV6E784_9ACTN
MHADAALEQVVREEWGRLVALLLAQFRRLDLVEDALGDAVEAAQRHWPVDGTPANPAGWLMTAARRRVLDRLRTEEVSRRKQPLLLTEAEHREEGARTMADGGALVEDDVLRLVLMCAHPALAAESASALSLRLVLGVPTADVARLFLVPEATMAARITRAKKRIVGAGIPFAVPDASVLPDRLDTVAQTAYLAFTAGYSPGTGPDLLRADLAGQAVRLVRVVLGLRPDEPALLALLALELLQHSRRDARVHDGRLVLLADQDRTRWHHDEVAEAMRLLAHPALTGPVTPLAASYALQARIAAEHATAASADDTRWDRVVGWYDLLLQVAPSPSARLARAVAVAEDRGTAAGLAALEGLEIPDSHRPAAVRAELLRRAGDTAAARAAYDQAVAACRNDVERAFLEQQRDTLPR